MDNNIATAQPSKKVLDYLLKRRSCPIKLIRTPGPDQDQIQTILRAASRVPDHGKMFPWYFIVFEGEARKDVGQIIKKAYLEENPDAAEAKLELEKNRFMRAPLVIGVISRAREGKHPLWEQILIAGAACQNLGIAANAMGFASNWLTEWYSYNDTFRRELGLDRHDHIAGFIHIGTPEKMPEERTRPDLDKIVTHWEPNADLNKGEDYNRDGMGYPKAGFYFKE